MFQVNENYLKLPGSYLFSTIGKKVSSYAAAHPEETVIRLGIGDVTQPLPLWSLKPSIRRWMKWEMHPLFTAMRRTWAMNS